jgi:MraZ protein
MSFRGRHDHTLDNKGRVSIPAGFRMEIQKLGGTQPPLLTWGKDHLILFPAQVWEVMERDLGSKSSLLPDVQKYQRLLIGGCSECPIDSQGRITIPGAACEHADLSGKVTLAGVLNKIEIWNHERFENDLRLTLERHDEIQMSVEKSTSGPSGASGFWGG